MTVTIHHLFQLLAALAGLLLFSVPGFHYFGWPGVALLTPLGAIVGYRLGGIPWLLTLRNQRKQFDKESTEELMEGLTGKHALYPNLVLAYLRIRGVDIRPSVPYLCDLMSSDDFYARNRGWVALRSALPECAAMIPDYHPARSKAECITLVNSIRSVL